MSRNLYNETDSPRDKFRHAVLDALDAEATKFDPSPYAPRGWVDAELPGLFRAIDRVCDRLGLRGE
jgi:hypothetical protein